MAKMKTINNKPLDVDFNNMDADGAIRLHLQEIVLQIKQMELELVDGSSVWLTDGDIEVEAILRIRDGIWVGIPNTNFRPVELSAPYHINNIINADRKKK